MGLIYLVCIGPAIFFLDIIINHLSGNTMSSWTHATTRTGQFLFSLFMLVVMSFMISIYRSALKKR